jgi:hypothetical protein
LQMKRLILFASLALVVLAGCFFALIRLASRSTSPLASGRLADGRILQIEGVTFGTQHHIGRRSIVEPVQPWLPRSVVRFFSPRYPHSDITLDEPGLVVWVNAIDAATGKHVDCQSIRMEFIDEHGDFFGQETSSWFGSASFWRAGHIFHAFPRTQSTLTLQVSCRKGSDSPVLLQFPNPCVIKPGRWQAHPLPQRLTVGDLEVELEKLVMRTNGGPKQFWQTPCRYWEPIWRLRRHGEEAVRWDEWSTTIISFFGDNYNLSVVQG